MFINSRTPPDLAHAQIRAWQRAKEIAFATTLKLVIKTALKRGLEKARIVRALQLAAQFLEQAGGA